MAEQYTIGTLATHAGVNVETIRYYQRRGLVGEPNRPPGRVRRYTAEHRPVLGSPAAAAPEAAVASVGSACTTGSGYGLHIAIAASVPPDPVSSCAPGACTHSCLMTARCCGSSRDRHEGDFAARTHAAEDTLRRSRSGERGYRESLAGSGCVCPRESGLNIN